MGKAKERDEPFLKAMLPDAHVRLAHPDSNDGATLLRRGCSFTDGTDGLGRLDAALRMGTGGLVATAFLAVGREGLETSLFVWTSVRASSDGTDGP